MTSIAMLVSTLFTFAAAVEPHQPPKPTIEVEQLGPAIAAALAQAAEDRFILQGVAPNVRIASDVSTGIEKLRAVSKQTHGGTSSDNQVLHPKLAHAKWAEYFDCPNAQLNGSCRMSRKGHFLGVFEVTQSADGQTISIWVTRLTKFGDGLLDVHATTVELIYAVDSAGRLSFRKTGSYRTS